jgi:hypothetical protein
VLLVVRATVPVGVEVPGATSDTVTIQEDEPPAATGEAHAIVVVVSIGVTVILAAAVEALLLWTVLDDVYAALTAAVPVADAVKLALQLAEAPVPLKVHGEPVKEPVAVPVAVNPTVPTGVIAVPAVEVSVTVAVQVEGWLTTTVLVHETVVLVVRGFTVMTAATVVLLPLWTVSVGV